MTEFGFEARRLQRPATALAAGSRPRPATAPDAARDRSRPSPAELLALRASEPAAMGQLYDAHHRALRGFCLRLLGDADGAEDLLHETFLSLPRALRRYRGERPLRSFLLGVAANHCRHHVRAAARRRRAHARAMPPAQAGGDELRHEQARAWPRPMR